ncbi:MAG TPA: NUDIX hydrolase [Magnetospirillaceae bacterium]|nr:NUDIX hydrolase [Magnetospirillaceae bacterium]
MIKVFVRAIVATGDSYLLMNDPDKNGKDFWDLPGGELKPGVDVRDHLRKMVLENTGYTVSILHFFEITCKVKPRTRGVDDSATTIDFVFAGKLEDTPLQPAAKETELLRYEKFEWLDSEGKYRANKVMALLGRYHRHSVRLADDAKLVMQTDTAD